jgi:alginate O-acetyltransferase complex protein AlgI
MAHDCVFGPLARVLGAGTAGALTFLFSGLVHEVAISAPARTGFGLPTAYFALQAAGIALARSALGRRLGLRRQPGARVLAWLCVCAPLGLLFHAGFLRRVVLPLLAGVGALP